MTAGIFKYSTTPSENVQANTDINWDEGMPPAAVNNSARQNMTDARLQWNDASWFQYGTGSKAAVVPVYASATSFTLAGVDVTAYWHVGRRVKAVGSGTGTIYGTISASAFSTNTTVTVIWDSGSLSNETLTVYASTVQVTGSPVPLAAISGSPILQNYLTGLTLSTAGSSATFATAAGQAADSTNAAMMTLAASISKTTSSWAVGSTNGGLDTGSIANSTWYHVYLIKRIDTGVVDVLFSLSATSPTMPANYTLKRRIGSIATNGSAQWRSFSQNGDEFLWTGALTAISQTPSTTATLHTLDCPTGVVVNALLRNFFEITGNGNFSLYCPDETAAVDVPSGNELAKITGSTDQGFHANVRTNTSAQVYRQYSGSGSSPLWRGCVYGWIDPRGRNG